MLPLQPALIAAVLFFSYAYFYQGTGWNQDSHFALARSLVERHTVCIDHYQNSTGDKAYYQGHYYSDKAPGLSLAAVPPVAAGISLAHWLHLYPWKAASVQLYLATVFTCSLAIALAAAVCFAMLLGWGMTPGAALFAVVVFGLGTPMWIYATQFWGHALASACLVFGFAAAEFLRRTARLRARVALGGAVGLLAGWAVVSEYPAAIPAAMIGVMALVYCWRSANGRRAFLYPGGALCLTAGLCLAVLLIYQKAAFGSPFRLGYEYVVNYQETLRHGELGLSYPKLHPLLALLFGKRCGLLLFTPILVVAPLGFRLLWRAGVPRLSLFVSAGIAIYYILFNASYLYWQAGASFGPRYLSAGLPFACLFVAPVWQWAKPPLKVALAAIAAYGTFVALAGATTSPMISEAVTFPLRVTLPAFTRGLVYEQGGSWNLGSLAGLHGGLTVTPLLIIWGVAAVVWWRCGRVGGHWSRAADTQHLFVGR
ncbi:MAG TPA: hypothetical protein VLC12_00085 [Terriglobales bacterium]|nr:hypothetical protein [Terriglobales bacterium]